ncbi:MAG: C2 family cysteine protease [Chloroflexota bacterium]
MLQSEMENHGKEFSLSRHPSEILSRQPSPLLTRSHQTPHPQPDTSHFVTDSTEPIQPQSTVQLYRQPPIAPLSLLKVQRTTNRLHRHHPHLQPTIKRAVLHHVSVPTPDKKTSDDNVIQREQRTGNLLHPNNRNNITVYEYTEDNDGVTVKTGFSHRGTRKQLAYNHPVSVDLDVRDKTGEYVEIKYEDENSTEQTRYVQVKYVKPNVNINPTLHPVQAAVDQGLGYDYEDRSTLPLFPHNPTVNDVKQGMLGDCYFVAAVASIVKKSSKHIKNMMVDRGDRVVVRFYNDGEPEYVVVDKQVPIFTRTDTQIPRYRLQSGGYVNDPYARGSLWMMLLEKAYAVFNGWTYEQLEGGQSNQVFSDFLNISSGQKDISRSGPDDKNALPWLVYDLSKKEKELFLKRKKLFPNIFNNNMERIKIWDAYIQNYDVSGNSLDAIQASLSSHSLATNVIQDVMKYLATNRLYSGYSGSRIYSVGDLAVYNDIRSRINSGEILAAATPNNYGTNNNGDIEVKRGIHANHTYSIIDTKSSSNVKYIKVRNPWGTGGISYQSGPSRDYSTRNEKIEQDDNDNGGLFWIELTHFLETFAKIYYTDSDDD